MEEKKLICIGCPKGCSITIEHTGKTINTITGYNCDNGLKYAQNEFTEPKRIVTTTVKINGGMLPFVPVKTREAVNKEKIFDVMKVVSQVAINSPVQVGDVIVADIAGTGVDLVCTRSIKKVS